jgi:NAD(P)-dependent dehydrogenase (short-subunit alcohol dehydrogenase family)
MDYEINSMFGIRDDVAIVTGAASGIGREIAKGMASLGARIVLVDINEEKLNDTEKEFRMAGFDIISIKTDMTHKESVDCMAKSAFEHFGKIDILINTAGVYYLENAENFNVEKWEWVMDVNVKGTMLSCQAVGRYMLKTQKGRIVNYTSVRGSQGRAGNLAYATSKGAINTLTKTLAIEWVRNNINVNAVAPIFTLTDMTKEILDDKKTYDWIISRLPKGRLCEAGLLVGPTIFLCSKCAEFITGHILYVDGGWMAG